MSEYFFKTLFGVDGDKATIPLLSQPDGSVSFQDGFTVDYQQDPDVDPTAKDIPRDQFNQLMYWITQAVQQYQVQGFPNFITTSDNGGTPYSYGINATVRFVGGWAGAGAVNYYSLVDANTATPADNTKWGLVSYVQQTLPTGTILEYTGGTLPDATYVWANGTTIGNAASGGTGRANADTQTLFTLLWNTFPNTTLPIQTSAGAASTRGVSAAADYAANKRLPVPNRCDVVGVGKSDMGGVAARGLLTLAVAGFSPTTIGATGGAEGVQLTSNQNGTHNHGITIEDGGNHRHATGLQAVQLVGGANAHVDGAGSGQTQFAGTHTHNATSSDSGLGSVHLNVQPTMVCNYIIKL